MAGMNTIALNSVYNHFLTSYAPKTSSSFDTHKKSELRNIYNSIVKQNKESPLYMIDTGKETQAFAVGIKENARSLRNVISSLVPEKNANILERKTASSSNEAVVEAKFVGTISPDEELPSFEIEVNSLASSQVNLGKFIPSDKMGLSSDTYSFDVHVNDSDYEFQFNVNDGDTNKSIQDKLARLITRSNIGIDASVMEDGEGNSSLRLESTSLGIDPSRSFVFSVSDDKTSKTSGAVNYLGIDEISRPATNASFVLNGIERTAFSNTFTVDKKFELSLKGISQEGDATTIGLKPDVDSLTDNVNSLIDGYNSFIQNARSYTSTGNRSAILLSEMGRITDAYRNELDSLGLTVQEDNTISVDEKLLRQTAEDSDIKSSFSTIQSFVNSLIRKSDQVSLNPLNYVEKTVVAYKNPGKSFANPYMPSMYSGMMFNSYC